MTNSNISILSIVAIAAVAGFFVMPTSTTRVIEYGCLKLPDDPKCKGIGGTGLGCTPNLKFTSDGQCPGKLIRMSSLRFTINQETGAVAFAVDRNIGDWPDEAGRVLDKCAIVDSENWQCKTGEEETIRVLDGVYLRSSPGIGGYEVPGYTGWRYWRERVLTLIPKEWLRGV